VTLSLACPHGYDAAGQHAELRLVHTRAAQNRNEHQPLSWTGFCRARERQIALIVHTEGIADLPVVVDGAPRATTDADGNAHVLLNVPANAPVVHVSLDTSRDPQLEPRNPARAFAPSDSDGLLVFEASVARARARHAAPPKRRAAEQRGPYRLR
jgi:hypothetical protein